MKKIVFLGCENSHAATFMDFIKQNEKYSDVEIVGAYSDDKEALAAFCDKYGIPAMENYDSAVGKVDGIAVTARHGDNHLKYAKPYMTKGMTAFIDKPVTVKEEDALELVRMCRDNGVKLTGGSALRFDATVCDLKEKNEKKVDGDTLGGFFRFPISLNNAYGNYFFYAQHLIESVGAVFGFYPVSIKSYKQDGAVTVVFRYPEYDVVGLCTDNCYTYYAVRAAKEGTEGGPISLDGNPCFLKEFDEFYRILSGEEQKCNLHDFIAPVFMMNAIVRSLESGKEEPVKEYTL